MQSPNFPMRSAALLTHRVSPAAAARGLQRVVEQLQAQATDFVEQQWRSDYKRGFDKTSTPGSRSPLLSVTPNPYVAIAAAASDAEGVGKAPALRNFAGGLEKASFVVGGYFAWHGSGDEVLRKISVAGFRHGRATGVENTGRYSGQYFSLSNLQSLTYVRMATQQLPKDAARHMLLCFVLTGVTGGVDETFHDEEILLSGLTGGR